MFYLQVMKFGEMCPIYFNSSYTNFNIINNLMHPVDNDRLNQVNVY